MRIGVDALFIQPGVTGGVETYARALVTALAQVAPDDEITVFVRDEAREGWSNASSVEVACVSAGSARRCVYGLVQTWLPLAAAQRRIDVLHHVWSYGSLTWPRAEVITIHDLITESFYQRLHLQQRPIATRLRRMLFAASLRRAGRVVVPTHAVASELLRFGISADRIVVTGEGAPEPRVMADLDAVKRHGLIPGGYLLTVSRFIPHKNLPSLVRGYIRSRLNIPLVIVGVPDFPSYASSVLADVAEQTGKLGTRQRILALGWVPDAELQALYGAARAFAFPSLCEGFGLPPLEALRAGVPIAVSDIPVHREVLGEAALYFRPTDVEAIARSLQQVCLDEYARSELRQRTAATLERHDWRACADRTLRTYRCLAPRSMFRP